MTNQGESNLWPLSHVTISILPIESRFALLWNLWRNYKINTDANWPTFSHLCLLIYIRNIIYQWTEKLKQLIFSVYGYYSFQLSNKFLTKQKKKSLLGEGLFVITLTVRRFSLLRLEHHPLTLSFYYQKKKLHGTSLSKVNSTTMI